MIRVSIVRGKAPSDLTIQALDLLDAFNAIPRDKPVLIKPNYINASHPSTGITTDGRVVEGVVRYLKQKGAPKIIIGEGCGQSDTFRAFKTAGINEIAERFGVELMDLNKEEHIEVSPPKPLALKRVKVARTALESAIISVPKLKLHRTTGVSLSIKNMMGAMAPKGSMHDGNLSKNIADLASIIKPCLSVVDGIIGGEGDETSNHPVKMELVIAGKDPVAVDAVGAAVMDVNPENVKHLGHAEEKGLGIRDLEKIEVIGEPIQRIKRRFRPRPELGDQAS